MQPVIATKGKLTQIRYDLSHRVHDATIYPVTAPNGSTIILYGHDTGVGIIWRGGRPLKKGTSKSKQPAKAAKVNGADDAIMIIDSDDEAPAAASQTPAPEAAEFEDEEEELDPEHPYPSIMQHLSLSLNTEVLHITVPQIPTISALRPAETIPPIFTNKMVFSVVCADATLRVITLPLSPPSDAAKEKPLSAKSQYGEEIVKVHGHQSIARGTTMTWTSRAELSAENEAEDEMDIDGDANTAATPGRKLRKQQSRTRAQVQGDEGYDLLVASHSAELGGLLKIWRFELAETSLNVTQPVAPYKSLRLRQPASRVAFSTAQYPKRRHSQLLIADSAGTVRVYDPFASAGRNSRASGQNESGAFVATFRSTFESVKTNAYTPAILSARKAVIDAAWASDGNHILILLADGEWGLWDVDRSGPSPSADPAGFSLRGFVGTSDKESSSSGASSPKRSGRSMLAPMTPNTRRKKEENLFQGSSSTTSVATRGGISVASMPSTNGAGSEDAVVIWYGPEIYRIADLAKFRARTISATTGSSLPGPGLAKIQDVSLLGEGVTAISQFATTTQAVQLAVPRDTLISTEHRIIITTATNRSQGSESHGMFVHEQAETEDLRRTDQALLSHGELDIGGMDRLLDEMGGSATLPKALTLGNPRKVLFASSAA